MKWFLIVWFALSAALSVWSIGKPRGPVTRAEATFSVAICLTLAICITATS